MCIYPFLCFKIWILLTNALIVVDKIYLMLLLNNVFRHLKKKKIQTVINLCE